MNTCWSKQLLKMRAGEIFQGYCASSIELLQQIDPELKAEMVLIPKFYKYTLELVSINQEENASYRLGRQSDFVCVNRKWICLSLVPLLASICYLAKALLKKGPSLARRG